MPEGVKSAAASLARTINKVLNAVAGGPGAMLDFYGHPFSHPIDDDYFSQCPIRYGDHVAKLGAFPASADRAALKDRQLDPHADEDGFRHAAIRYFDEYDVVFDLRERGVLPPTPPYRQAECGRARILRRAGRSPLRMRVATGRR